jgi:hypothetical protein
LTKRALILLNVLIAIVVTAEFYAPYARTVQVGTGPLPNGCQVFAVAKQCDLARSVLGRCSWSRVIALNYRYSFKRPQGHALLAYDLNGRIYVYDANEGTYPLDVPKGCHDLRPIAEALKHRDKYVFNVYYLD